MKKIYIVPTTTTIQVELQNMIAVSTTGLNTVQEIIETQNEDAVTDGMSRGSFWDDFADF